MTGGPQHNYPPPPRRGNPSRSGGQAPDPPPRCPPNPFPDPEWAARIKPDPFPMRVRRALRRWRGRPQL